MRLPGFTGDLALSSSGAHYRLVAQRGGSAGAVVPAIPPCRNCDYICDVCLETGRACGACAMCGVGVCDPRGPGET
jgi:hypothetical protein